MPELIVFCKTYYKAVRFATLNLSQIKSLTLINEWGYITRKIK